MKQQKYNEGNFGTKPQKAVKSGQHNKTWPAAEISQPAKFCSYENSHHCKISAMLTLPLYLPPIAFFFVRAASMMQGWDRDG